MVRIIITDAVGLCEIKWDEMCKSSALTSLGLKKMLNKMVVLMREEGSLLQTCLFSKDLCLSWEEVARYIWEEK